jgi:hypothetical protein
MQQQGSSYENILFYVKNFCNLYTASLITAKHVIPAKAGIQENTGFPRIKYGAGLVKPGMTNRLRFISLCIERGLG